jgi:hypothetical protein
MKLKDIYDQIAYGELRHVVLGTGPIATAEGDGIPKENYEKIYPFVTMALTELHKRFLLRERTLSIELQGGQVSYVISTAFAESNAKSAEAVKYIKDSADPFEDDFMQIERVYGTYLDKAYEIPLNEIDNGESIRTSAYNILQVPDDPELACWLNETANLKVVYRANHPSIRKILANAAPGQTEIYLPHAYMEPLIWYIASRATNVGGIQQEFHEGNNYYSKFEAACALINNQNLRVNSYSENTKLTDRGFI